MSWNPFKKKDKKGDTAKASTPAASSAQVAERTPVGRATAPAAAAPAATAPAATASAATAHAATSSAMTTPTAAEPAADTDAAGAPAAPGSRTPAELHHDVVEVLKTIFDPEIPVNIYDLSLIYDIGIQDSGDTDIKMTLTSPMCPVAGSLPPEVETKVRTVSGIGKVAVELVWEPAWSPELLREDIKLQLGIM